MKTNINIDFRFAKPGQVERIESIPLVVKLKLKGGVFAHALDITEFLKSLTETGRLPLFTCKSCGIFGCEGYYVEIEHTTEHYILNGSYSAEDPTIGLDLHRDEIPWWQLQAIVKQLREAIASIPHGHPHLEKYIETGWLPSLNQFDEAIKIIQRKSTPKR